ncbi:metallophosphoesterase family protein, partial [Patescibacteria group bacterium]
KLCTFNFNHSLLFVLNSLPAAGDISDAITKGSEAALQYKIAFIADSENNNISLEKVLMSIKKEGAHSVFFLGDYTAWGSIQELEKARNVMDNSGVTYYSLPGDHDLGQSIGPENYNIVFANKQETVVEIKGTKFLLLNNSANKTLISASKIDFFETELSDADFVLLSQPLYHHGGPSILRPIMGYLTIDGELARVADVNEQAGDLIALVRNSDVKAIFAGDHHSFSVSQDKVRQDLMHIVIGAVTDSYANQGKSSVTFLSIYDDGTYFVEEVLY